MNTNRQQSIDKLRNLVESIETAMLTTIDNGVLRSRPMGTREIDLDGNLWFFTNAETHKVSEIMKDNRVSVTYASPENSTYVSITGTAEFSTDETKIVQLWDPIEKAWYPKGLNDPTLVLLMVNVEQAEYWDANKSAYVQIKGFLKAAVTGEKAVGSENRKLSMGAQM
ncbi:MAG: pyridoxamine 5'-phosphate oxidase family protein [Acidobacteria bacterium]|nr:pyridoxamine 5'-phosphate oxidase family protein [Acidobacteriota bacterium]